MKTARYRSETKLRIIRSGSFSGSAISLVRALESLIPIEDIDVASYRRDLQVMKGGLLSLVETSGRRVTPASKTAAWSSHVQKALSRDGFLDGDCPTLFIQSLHAFTLPPPIPHYAIYTDRVGREGAAVGGVHRSRFTRGWLRREEHFLREAAIVFTMGPSTKMVLTQKYGLDPARVSVVGAGPNTPIGPQSRSTRLEKILFVGTQWELKGGPELLQSVRAARRVIGDLDVLVVGSTPEGPTPDGATFTGHLSDREMSIAYSRSDVLVIPTHMEAFGISIVEALLHGLPCVGTTVGNQEWLIGDAGLIVPPDDPCALTNALVTIAEDYSTFQRAALARSKIIGGVMHWPLVANKIQQALVYDSTPIDLTFG